MANFKCKDGEIKCDMGHNEHGCYLGVSCMPNAYSSADCPAPAI